VVTDTLAVCVVWQEI